MLRRVSAFHVLTGLAFALCVSGCGRCGNKREPVEVERFLPPGAAVSVVIPKLESASAQFSALRKWAGAGPAGPQIIESYAAIAAQLGFDPLDPKSTRDAGLDPDRAVAASISWEASPILILPVGDTARFEATVIRLSRDRFNASYRTNKAISGQQIVSLHPVPGAPAAFSFTTTQGFAVLSPGADSAAVVAAAAARDPQNSLAKSPYWARVKAALGGGAAALAFAPSGSPALSGLPFANEGVGVALQAGAASIHARGALLLPGRSRTEWQALAGPEMGRKGSVELLAALDPDMTAIMRFGGEFSQLGDRLVPMLPVAVAHQLADAKINPYTDVFNQLAPGAVLALALAPTFDLSKVTSIRSIDPRVTNPFTLVHLAGVGRLKTPEQAKALLERLPPLLTRHGATVTKKPWGKGGTAWSATYQLGEGATWAIEGDRLLVAGGAGRFEALTKRLATTPLTGGYQAPTPAARSALEAGFAGALLDVQNLVKSVRALPLEAFGTGPNGFVMRSMVTRVVEPAAQLRAAAVSVALSEAAVVVEARIEGLP